MSTIYLLTTCTTDDIHESDVDDLLRQGAPYATLEEAQAVALSDANYSNEEEPVVLTWEHTEGQTEWFAQNDDYAYWLIRAYTL